MLTRSPRSSRRREAPIGKLSLRPTPVTVIGPREIVARFSPEASPPSIASLASQRRWKTMPSWPARRSARSTSPASSCSAMPGRMNSHSAACTASNSATDSRISAISSASLTARWASRSGAQSTISPNERRARSTNDAGSLSSSIPNGPSGTCSRTALNPGPSSTRSTCVALRARSM